MDVSGRQHSLSLSLNVKTKMSVFMISAYRAKNRFVIFQNDSKNTRLRMVIYKIKPERLHFSKNVHLSSTNGE